MRTSSLKAVGRQFRSATIDSPRVFERRLNGEWQKVSRLGQGVVPGDRHHLLLAPAGGGNIGDQAMVEAFVENVAGSITVISWDAKDFPIPAEHRNRVRAIGLPGLVNGAAIRDEGTLQEFTSLLDGCAGVSIIGADVLDGGYSYRRSVQRTSLATYAARLGIDSRILGFSLNEAPDVRCVSALADAGRAGVRLLLRDPLSSERARALGLEGVQASADLVFSATTVRGVESVPELTVLDGPYVVINANSLIARKLDQTGEYRQIVEYLVDRGLQIVLVPHDSRKGSDDIAESRRVHERLGNPRILLIDRLLEPAQIRGLAAGASVVVTGRMHLAIMALYSSVPAIPLSYQGKIGGLMHLFGTEGLAVEPEEGFARTVTRNLDAVLSAGAELTNQLAHRLVRVRELSQRNYAGLTVIDGRAQDILVG